LGNNGYPQNCVNIGVAFSNSDTNPNTNNPWLRINLTWPLPDEEFSVTGDIAQSGSFLPLDVTQGFGRILFGLAGFNNERLSDPTFIPHNSALDIRNGVSMFDIPIFTSETTYHNVIPEDVVIPILASLGLLPNSTDYVHFFTKTGPDLLSGSLLVDGQITVQSSDSLSLTLNTIHNVIAIDRLFSNPVNDNFDKKHHDWNENNIDIKLSHDFWGWQNTQIANYSSIGNVQLVSMTPIALHDPWYLQNPNDLPSQWIQPDTFLPLSQQDDGHGNVQVFLDQNSSFNPLYPPINSLRAPK
jgi:hypothetical protein